MECTVDRAGKRLGMLYRIRGNLTTYCADLRRVGRIFRLGGGGLRLGSENTNL